MNDKSDEPIIDACLDEILGSQRPPDLTVRILRALDNAETKRSEAETSKLLVTPNVEATLGIKVQTPERVSRTRRQASPWLAVAMSLAIVGLGFAVVWITWNATELKNRRAEQIAAPESPLRPEQLSPLPPQRSITQVPPEPANDAAPPVVEQATPQPHALAVDSVHSPRNQDPIPEINIPDERPTPLAEEQIVLAINELIRDGWQRENITPATPVSDEQWCERVYSKLIGRVPNPQEVSSFVESRSANRRAELVDLLLQGETYVEEFAAHWSRSWADILIASGDASASREGLEQYLRRAFGEGKPFDLTTTELLTATGSGKIGAADYNGATNFLVAHTDRKGAYAQATAHVSRTFLGLSLECSQCHVDSTWSGIEQQQFWELNAFFRQLQAKREGERGVLLSDADIRAGGSRSTDGETYYPLLDGTIRTASPVFVDGTEIPRSPSVELVNRRDLLAKLVTRSEQFRQAMANRFWAEMFGVGFTIPADNIGPHNPPSHPELLAKLGGQFAAHDYDVRALIRWIALSEPFSLSSGDVATHDQIGAKLAFDRFPRAADVRAPLLARLQVARQAYSTFVDSRSSGATPARLAPTVVPGTAPQELSEIDRLLETVSAEASRLSKATVYGNYVLESNMSLEQKIQHMFFATLHRAPTGGEQKAVEDVLANSDESTIKTALEYVWWALASSVEAR